MMLPALLALSIPQAAEARPVTLRLGPHGEIEGWLVAKAPKTAFRAEGGEWRFAYARPDGSLDLLAVLGGENTHALVATTLVSDRPRRATLLFGTDDGGTLTLNGRELWRKEIVRGVKRDEERVELDLKAGENALVFRVDQKLGGWGLVARLEGDGLPGGEGLASRTDLLAAGDYPEIRMARSLPGRFDAEGAVRYAEMARRARVWDRNVGGGKALKDLVLSSPGGFGDTDALNAFFADRYARTRAAYEKARAPFLAKAQNPGPLFPEVKPEPGVRVMPGGRLFVDARGRPFIPIGGNQNPDWPDFERADPKREDYDPRRADAYGAKLRANGVNLIRLMVDTPLTGSLEDTVGVFSPEHMMWLDTVVASARKHGVRLMVTPYDTFWMNLRPELSPYWKANGGPLDPARKIEWYTSPVLREAQKRRNHWLIDRYGNLDTIFVWEPMNEADVWWGAKPGEIAAWTADVVADARVYQLKRWGVPRLLSVSTGEPMPREGLGEYAYRSPDLDIANTHLYIGAGRKAPDDPADVVGAESEGVRHAIGEIRDARPYMDTENGPIDAWIADEWLDNAMFHDQVWAHLASGGAGSGLRWPYRTPHRITDGMLDHLRRMRAFADAVDWTRFTGASSPITTVSYGGVSTGYRALPRDGRSGGALLFLVRSKYVAQGATLNNPVPFTIQGMPRGRVRLFDTHAGRWLPARVVVGKSAPGLVSLGPNGTGTIVLPPGVRSVCAVWENLAPG